MLRKSLLAVLTVGCLCGASTIGSAQDGIRKAKQKVVTPTYPIAEADVRTTVDSTIACDSMYNTQPPLFPCQLSEYEANGYGKWWNAEGFACVSPNMLTDSPNGDGCVPGGPYPPPPPATKLLSFFTISDIHITDKESPAQLVYFGYENNVARNSSLYSGIMLSTTQFLDAAVQTINAVHKKDPFDFGISLGDTCNSTQYNELRWYLDVLDGKKITPSSGARKGAKTIDYQKPYQAAGLDKSLPWYQVIGNHDQLWMGIAYPDDYIKKTITGSQVLNIGQLNPFVTEYPFNLWYLNTRGFYTGVFDGTTEFGNVINAGSLNYFAKPPKVAPDSKRKSLEMRQWMGEFFKTTSTPVGHGFTQDMIDRGFACYSFKPKAGIPIKVIAFDNTDKAGAGDCSIDNERFDWLVGELDAAEAAGELSIICSHIPINSYGTPMAAVFSPYSDINSQEFLNKLWSYKNILLWNAGHIHRNTITAQPAPNGNPENGFWEVETPSLRDFPRQFRRFDIYRNADNNISIYAIDVDPAVNPAPLSTGSPSPAWKARAYAIGAQQIFKNVGQWQGLHINQYSAVYNANLIKQLTPEMQAKIAQIQTGEKE